MEYLLLGPFQALLIIGVDREQGLTASNVVSNLVSEDKSYRRIDLFPLHTTASA